MLDRKTESVIERYEDLFIVAAQLAAAWGNLADLEAAQVDSADVRSIAHARENEQNAEQDRERMRREYERLIAVRQDEEREVPLDLHGRKRIPVQWDMKARKPSALRSVKSQEQHGRVGLENDRGAVKWVAWKQLADGRERLSEGWLWIAFDGDGRVMDVSLVFPSRSLVSVRAR